jgi:hypothetical protein
VAHEPGDGFRAAFNALVKGAKKVVGGVRTVTGMWKREQAAIDVLDAVRRQREVLAQTDWNWWNHSLFLDARRQRHAVKISVYFAAGRSYLNMADKPAPEFHFDSRELNFQLRDKPKPEDLMSHYVERVQHHIHQFAESLGLPASLIEVEFPSGPHPHGSEFTASLRVNEARLSAWMRERTGNPACLCPACGAVVEVSEDRGGEMSNLLYYSDADCKACGLWEREYQTGNHRERVGFKEFAWQDPVYPMWEDVLAVNDFRKWEQRDSARRKQVQEQTEETKRLHAYLKVVPDERLQHALKTTESEPEIDTYWLILADRLAELGLPLNEAAVRQMVEDRIRDRNDPKKNAEPRKGVK